MKGAGFQKTKTCVESLSKSILKPNPHAGPHTVKSVGSLKKSIPDPCSGMQLGCPEKGGEASMPPAPNQKFLNIQPSPCELIRGT